MSLNLLPDQPAESAGEQPQTAVIATLVTVDAVVVRIGERPDGSLAIMPSGNRTPLVFDRHQAGALKSVLAEEGAA